MKHNRFKKVKESLKVLSTGQFRELKEDIEAIESIKFVSKHLETNNNKLECPHCNCNQLLKWGKVSDLQRYRCKECKKTFNSLTKTPMARLKKKGRWLNYSKCLKEGLSIRKAAKICGVSVKTSFHWRHRFLKNHRLIKPQNLSGIIELKEYEFPLSFKGSKKDYMEYIKVNSTPISKQKVFVIFAKDRYKNTYDNIVIKFEKDNLSQSLNNIVSNDSLICSDNKKIYCNCFSELGLRHGKLNLGENEFVRKNIVHIKTVSEYNKLLIDWMHRFRGVATKYLDSYISWYRSLEEFNMSIPSERLLSRAKQPEKYNHQ